MPPLRGPARGAFGRLRPVDIDPLETYGLPSKGETRLADRKTQERFYALIVDRYMQFCTDSSGRDNLLERFGSYASTHDPREDVEDPVPDPAREPAKKTAGTKLSAWTNDNWRSKSLSGRAPAKTPKAKTGAPKNGQTGQNGQIGPGDSSGQTGQTGPTGPAVPGDPVHPTSDSVAALAAASKDLTLVLSALRKLREAIVATDRVDEFAKQVYLFCIRLAILAKHPPSYHPALLHLLRAHNQRMPLLVAEVREVARYRILDAACRRGDLAEAYHLRAQYRVRCDTIDTALYAIAHDDWIALHRLQQRAADAHHRRLLEYALHDMRIHTLKCFGRAYLRLDDVHFLETQAGVSWDRLTKEYSVGWERDEDAVIIRRAIVRKPDDAEADALTEPTAAPALPPASAPTPTPTPAPTPAPAPGPAPTAA